MTRALRRALPSLFPPLLLLLALCFPAACVRGVKTGLETGLFSLIPSLFPSLVLSRLAVSFLPSPGRRTALILPPLLGSLCGFPLGAQLCVNLYRRGALSKKDAEDLLFCSNNAGGIFLVSVCGVGLFGQARIGYFLLAAQSVAVLCFFFLRFGKSLLRREASRTPRLAKSPSLSGEWHRSLKEAGDACVMLLSCVMFFSFLTELFACLFKPAPFFRALISLFSELAGGTAALSALPTETAFLLCCGGVGWGGCSVLMQSLLFVKESDLDPKRLWQGKISLAAAMLFFGYFFKKLL